MSDGLKWEDMSHTERMSLSTKATCIGLVLFGLGIVATIYGGSGAMPLLLLGLTALVFWGWYPIYAAVSNPGKKEDAAIRARIVARETRDLERAVENDRILLALGLSADGYRRYVANAYGVRRDDLFGKFVVNGSGVMFDTLDEAIGRADTRFRADTAARAARLASLREEARANTPPKSRKVVAK